MPMIKKSPVREDGFLRLCFKILLSKNLEVQTSAIMLINNVFAWPDLSRNVLISSGIVYATIQAIVSNSITETVRKASLDLFSLKYEKSLPEFGSIDRILKYVNSNPGHESVDTIITGFCCIFDHDLGRIGGVSQVYVPRMWEMLREYENKDDFHILFISLITISLSDASIKEGGAKNGDILLPVLKQATEICLSKDNSHCWDFVCGFSWNNSLLSNISADQFYADKFLWKMHVLEPLKKEKFYSQYTLDVVSKMVPFLNSEAESFLNSDLIQDIFQKFKDPCTKYASPFTCGFFELNHIIHRILVSKNFPQNKAHILLDSGVMQILHNIFHCLSSRDTVNLAYESFLEFNETDSSFATKFEEECKKFNIEKQYECFIKRRFMN
jgi:hypothetical protein